MAEKKRAYCKNTVQGRQRGRKYPPKFRAEVVMAMLTTNSICAVARRYGVPESTIRTWVAEEAKRGDAWAEERRAAAREIALRASLGTRARDFSIGTLLKSEDEALADAAEVGLVVYASQGSYDRQLDPDEEKLLARQLERYEGRTMTDKDAANMTKVLMTVAERAAAMLPGDNGLGEKNSPPMVEIGAEKDADEKEIVVEV